MSCNHIFDESGICFECDERKQMTPSEFKQARQKLGLTQLALANAIGMTSKMVGMMERGQAGIELRTELAIKQLITESDKE